MLVSEGDARSVPGAAGEGEALAEALDPARETVAGGASCRTQLSELCDGTVRHPVEGIAPRDGPR